MLQSWLGVVLKSNFDDLDQSDEIINVESIVRF